MPHNKSGTRINLKHTHTQKHTHTHSTQICVANGKQNSCDLSTRKYCTKIAFLRQKTENVFSQKQNVGKNKKKLRFYFSKTAVRCSLAWVV